MAGFLSKLFKDADPEADTAKAWGVMNEQIKRDEGKAEDDAWEKKFSSLRNRGLSASAIDTPVYQQEWSQEEGKMVDTDQKVAGTGEGFVPPKSTPLERWKKQIDGMIQSGDPTLAKTGLDLIKAYQARSTAQTTDSNPNSFKEWQLAKQHDGYNGSFQDWKMLNKSSGTTVNTGDDKFKSSDYVIDGKGHPVSPPVGMNKSDAPADWTYGNRPTAEEARQQGSVDNSLTNLGRLRDVMLKEGGDVSGVVGWLDRFRSGTGLGPVVTNSMLSVLDGGVSAQEGEMISLTTTLGNDLLDAMRGAQVGPAEQEKFEKQLPMPGQSKRQFLTNMATTYRNLANMSKRQTDLRGMPAIDLSGDFFEFELQGQNYRITSNGDIEMED